jgi:hypothetical protein
MTGGIVDWTEAPLGIPLLRKPIFAPDLISAVEEAIRRGAEPRAKLQASIARHLELRRESTRLIAECQDEARRLADTIRESHQQRTKRKKEP